MNNFKYCFLNILSKLPFIKRDLITNRLRKEGCKIGVNTHMFSNVSPEEPYLVEIGDCCTISSNVSFITHDASIGIYLGREKFSDICGKIIIGNNCFIGKNTTILYGVTIPNNTIIAAGSVVTKSVKEPNCIIGGNPARVLGKVSDFIEKAKPKAINLHGLDSAERKERILNSKIFIQK